jgi:phosphomannomutase
MQEIAERYSDGEQNTLDGISVDYDDWHFNVRPSNTEPLLRLNLESLVSREHMEQKRDEVLALIHA